MKIETRLTKLPMQVQLFSHSTQFHYIRLQDRLWMLRCLCVGDDVLLNCMIPANSKGRSCNCRSHLFTYRCITYVDIGSSHIYNYYKQTRNQHHKEKRKKAVWPRETMTNG